MIKIRPLLLLLLYVLPASAPAQTLIEGKLFSSPEQREYLDYLRRDSMAKNKQTSFNVDDSEVPEIPGSAPGVVAPIEYSLDAIITVGGRKTIFLNHHPITEQQLPANFRLVEAGNSPALEVKTNVGHTQLLRPGQTIDVTSGLLKERLHKPAPKEEKPKPDTSATNAKVDNKNANKNDDGTADEKAAVADSASSALPQPADKLPAKPGKEPSAVEKTLQTLKLFRDVLDATNKR